VPVFSQNNSNTSIAMLNYLATETRIISNSKNNRLALEEIYTKLINNTNPSIIDVTTQDFLQILLDDIEKFRILTLQRERLEYIFENQQAQVITQALPNPLYLLGSRDRNPLSLIASAALMTIDSVFKYQNASNNAEMDFLKENWELDDRESATLHNLRSRTFSYMIDIARSNNLGMADTLNEQSIDRFVNYSSDENFQRRRQSLEGNRSLYEKYAPYWLKLAETYYYLELYQDCIDAVRQYEAIQTPIFRKDYDFAQILPKMIISLSNVHGINSVLELSKQYLEKLVLNTTDADWALRYFAAQSYISMAGVTDRRINLTAAYNLLVSNVTYLSHEQEILLSEYVSPIDERIPQGLTKDRERQIKKIISELKKRRNYLLPPMHEGLLLNYQTLLQIMQELNTSTQERNRINSIVDKSFVYKIMRHSFFNEPYDSVVITSYAYVEDTALSFYDIPVVFLFPGFKADIKITDNNGSETVIFQEKNVECLIGKISRRKDNNIDSFNARLFLNYSDGCDLFKEKQYYIYVTFYYGSFKYTLRFNKTAGTGHFLGVFSIKPPVGIITYD
jgi:hypothetical protein